MAQTIGRTIARLRHERGVTQEALALAVGVSAPAVSKWETGQSCPDIALLAPLARFFSVSTDTLLGFQPSLTEAEQAALQAEVDETFAKGGWDAGLARCEALLREHPADMALRVLLAARLMGSMAFTKTPQQREAGRARQIAWLEEAAARAEGDVKTAAQYTLGMLYLQTRRLPEAEALLGALQPAAPDTRQVMPTLRLLQERYDEAMRLAQQNLLATINEAVTALGTMVGIAVRQGAPDTAMAYADAARALARTVGMEGLLVILLASMRMSAAHAAGDTQALLDAAEGYAQALQNGPVRVASPCLSELYADGPTTLFSSDEQSSALRAMAAEDLAENEAFADVRDTPRFARILRALRGEAGGAP